MSVSEPSSPAAQVRVRFAPSPTGYLHVGGARTAIFNWLYARHHGGVFVLRIEDTDLARSSGPMTQAILDGMEWLGLSADEGPYYQAAQRDRHVADATQLMKAGKAYRCFCSSETIKHDRDASVDYMYPRTCRDIAPDESTRRADAGESFAVRFAVPQEGKTRWVDEVHEETAFANNLIDDFILLRSDGSPTYMLSVVSDDVAMRITHVIRGDDHISNTPKQILLYEALGNTPPSFAHLPLIFGDDKKRLSKRHGALSVLDYRDQGYLPETMLNFLALLGWSPGDDRQVMDRETLIREFSLGGVGRSGAVFDLQKLDWLNGEILSALPLETLQPLVEAELRSAGRWDDAFHTSRQDELRATLALLQSRMKRPADFVEMALPFLDPSDDLDYEPKASKKHLKGEVAANLEAWIQCLEQLPDWTPEPMEAALRDHAESRGIGAGKLIHPTRLAVTGKGVSPGIFEVLELLGRERSLRRMNRLLDHVRTLPTP